MSPEPGQPLDDHIRFLRRVITVLSIVVLVDTAALVAMTWVIFG